MILIALLAVSTAQAQPAGPAAGSVVRSKEWVIRRGENREEEFIGNVLYDSAGTHMSSDWALFKHVTKEWQARGHVRVRRILKTGDVLEVRGERATHSEKSKIGTLDPARGERVSFVRTPPEGETDQGEGGRISWVEDDTVTLLQGAKVWGPRLQLEADEALYEFPKKSLHLNGGRPVLQKVEGEWITALKADQITAVESPRRIEATGKVKGWMIFKNEAKLKELAK